MMFSFHLRGVHHVTYRISKTHQQIKGLLEILNGLTEGPNDRMPGLLIVYFAMVGTQSFEQRVCCLDIVVDLGLVGWNGHNEYFCKQN